MSMRMTMWRLNAEQMMEVFSDPTKGAELASTMVAPPMPVEMRAQMEARLATMDASKREHFERLLQSSEDPAALCLDKLWHVVNYLLTKDPSVNAAAPETTACRQIVLGGKPTNYTVGEFGPALTLDGESVAACATALSKISDQEIHARADPAILNVLKLYSTPWPGGWSDRELQSVWTIVTHLRAFYSAAAANGDHIFKAIV